jgi:hypothetical protein
MTIERQQELVKERIEKILSGQTDYPPEVTVPLWNPHIGEKQEQKATLKNESGNKLPLAQAAD